VLQPDDSGIEYTLKEGKMYDGKGGPLSTGKVSFIITAEGRLVFGNFHTGLSKGNSTIMAGELKITNGVCEYASRVTGHYCTSKEEQQRGFDYMKKCYSWIVIDDQLVDELDRPKSLFELFASQPKLDMSFSFMSPAVKKEKPTVGNINQANVNPSVNLARPKSTPMPVSLMPPKSTFPLVTLAPPKSTTTSASFTPLKFTPTNVDPLNSTPTIVNVAPTKSTAIYGTRADLPQPAPGSRRDPVTGQWVVLDRF
jgi:hypothetical protein